MTTRTAKDVEDISRGNHNAAIRRLDRLAPRNAGGSRVWITAPIERSLLRHIQKATRP